MFGVVEVIKQSANQHNRNNPIPEEVMGWLENGVLPLLRKGVPVQAPLDADTEPVQAREIAGSIEQYLRSQGIPTVSVRVREERKTAEGRTPAHIAIYPTERRKRKAS